MAYDHRSIEARWQRYWEEQQTFKAVRHPGRPKYYVLDMFPYPSGAGLHVGHPEGYTATDIVARYKRMRGFDVLHPMGWDAFGLPAEQHAIQTGTHPAQTTRANIATFRRQLKRLGFSYDWSREVDTTDPKYVRCTQWIFLKLFERGLAFQAETPVNWCPELGTVLANEEVIDGRSERGGYPVERRPLRQWQLRITAYADRLAEELEGLDWPETRQKQRDWIGKSVGAEVHFPIAGRSERLTVYTTRPDTLYGATYLVIAPDHPLTLELATDATRAEVSAYVRATAKKSDRDRTAAKAKTGVFTGAYATNPLNQRKIPIYTADYVLGAYGTGAIMAVPAHDERDFEFARFMRLPVVEVVSPDGSEHEYLECAYTGDGIAVRSGPFTGQRTEVMKENIIRHLEDHGLGGPKTQFKLRDWTFSRQRYWGEPIPIYFPVVTDGDPRCGAPYHIDYETPIPVPESELPLLLPELDDYRPDDPAGALAKAVEFRFFERDGRWFARETNTMPQWAGSCWYYLRYLDPENERELFSSESYDAWMPVDLYVGGSEHAVLHLLYARFWHKVLFDLGLVKHPEPFVKLVHQGMVLGMSYRWYAELDERRALVRALPGSSTAVVRGPEGDLRHAETGRLVEARWLNEREVAFRGDACVHPEYGVELEPIAEKMSKARGNVTSPDEVVDEFGADAFRLYEMFMGPLEHTKPWQTSGLQGCRRFLERVVQLSERALDDGPPADAIERALHRVIKKVGEDIEALRFNTAISALMIFTNELTALEQPPRVALQKLLLCLSPFAPHLAEELFPRVQRASEAADGRAASASTIAYEPWPAHDESKCIDDVVEVPVQVNGRVRARVKLPRAADEAVARQAALSDPQVQKLVLGKSVANVVYVPGRIVNVIVS